MFAFAILKFSVGVLLIVVQPSSFNCPRECDYSQCEQIHPNYVYRGVRFDAEESDFRIEGILADVFSVH